MLSALRTMVEKSSRKKFNVKYAVCTKALKMMPKMNMNETRFDDA